MLRAPPGTTHRGSATSGAFRQVDTRAPQRDAVGATAIGKTNIGAALADAAFRDRAPHTDYPWLDFIDTLKDAEAEKLSRRLSRSLWDASPQTRSAGAEALGRIGSSWSRAVLPRVARADSHSPGRSCNGDGCWTYYPVREAVEKALAQVEHVVSRKALEP